MEPEIEELVAAAVEAKAAWDRALADAVVLGTGAGAFARPGLDRLAQLMDRLGEALGDLEQSEGGQ